MKINQDTAKQLFLLLKQELGHAATMLKLLQQEYEALRSNSLEDFDKILFAKQEQAALLDKFEDKVSQIKGLPDELKKPPALIAYFEQGGSQALAKAWSELQNTLRQCQTQNIVNNQVIEASRVYLQDSLSILRGGVVSKPTYKASGKTDNNSSGNTLAYA